MGAIQYVKSQQEDIMHIFDHTQQTSHYSDSIPIIQPALRWAQNPHNVFIEVKYSTRFDSPACLDIYDAIIRIDDGRTLFLQAMCRNDKKILKYELTLDLFENVQPFEMNPELIEKHKDLSKDWDEYLELNKTYFQKWDEYKKAMKKYKVDLKEKELNKDDPYGASTNDDDDSEKLFEPVEPDIKEPVKPTQPPNVNTSVYEMQSVGRVYFNLTKSKSSRWKKLIPEQISKKPQNMGVWWELYEKYEKELVQFDPWEDDDEELLKTIEKDKKKADKDKGKDEKSKGTDKASKSKVCLLFLTFYVCLEKNKKGSSSSSKEPKEDL